MKKIKVLGVLLLSLFMPIFVKAESGIARIGDNTYSTLQEAVDSVPDNVDTTIEILRSGKNIPGFKLKSGKSIIIDFNNYTLELGEPLVGSTGTVSQNFQLLKGSKVVLKNGTLKAAATAKMLIQNYSDLILEDMTLDATTMEETEDVYALSSNNGIVNIMGETNIYSNGYAFDVYYWPINSNGVSAYPTGTQVYVDTTGIIRGTIDVSGSTNLNSTSTLQILNINHEGTLSVMNGLEDNVNISGGTYEVDVTKFLQDVNYQKLIEKDGKYTVYNKNSVIIGNMPENGNISIDKEEAYYGDIVNMNISPDEGYELESVKVKDFYNNEIKVEDNQFTMPNSDVWISVKFKVVQKIVAPVISETIKVGVKDTSLTENVLLESLKKYEEYKDASVNVEIVVEDIKATENITKEFTNALKDKSVNNGKIVNYFDISVAVKNAKTNETLGNLSELTDKVQFMVSVPQDINKVEDGYSRNYYIIKKHGDKIDILDGSLSNDGKYIIFETSEFSTYALAYEDKAIENIPNPQTFDGIGAIAIAGCVSLVGAVGICLYFKKEVEGK